MICFKRKKVEKVWTLRAVLGASTSGSHSVNGDEALSRCDIVVEAKAGRVAHNVIFVVMPAGDDVEPCR